jgi:hypothetical protein
LGRNEGGRGHWGDTVLDRLQLEIENLLLFCSGSEEGGGEEEKEEEEEDRL